MWGTILTQSVYRQLLVHDVYEIYELLCIFKALHAHRSPLHLQTAQHLCWTHSYILIVH